MDMTEYQFTNEYGLNFDFRYYSVSVSQELFHLLIRAQNARIWNWHHSDSSKVYGAFQAVVKAYQFKYDINKTPDVLCDEYKKEKQHPYEVYKTCYLLHDDEDFKLVQEEIITYLRHNGLNIRHPNASYYLQELDLKLNGLQLYDAENQLNAKGVVGRFLIFVYSHLTPRSIARFESVKCYIEMHAVTHN